MVASYFQISTYGSFDTIWLLSVNHALYVVLSLVVFALVRFIVMQNVA